ncbi:MAG: PAS domain S-box protein [Bacillota bacterium]
MLEEELNKIIETSNNNILITDQDGIILYSNPKLWEIYGMESDSYIGTSVYQRKRGPSHTFHQCDCFKRKESEAHNARNENGSYCHVDWLSHF